MSSDSRRAALRCSCICTVVTWERPCLLAGHEHHRVPSLWGWCFSSGDLLVRDNGSSVLKHESHHTESIHELPMKSGRSYCLLRPCKKGKTIASRKDYSKACNGNSAKIFRALYPTAQPVSMRAEPGTRKSPKKKK